MSDVGNIDPPKRLVSLDAYRGFIMLVMASGGFAIAHVASELTEAGEPSRFWDILGFQFSHTPWTGCSFWDLIQPSFMFMVGVAMPYSYASRRTKGKTTQQIAGHAVLRAIILILLGVFLSSNGAQETNFTFVNVLTQIGLGYCFVLLLIGRGLAVQTAALAFILVGYWLAFALYPTLPLAQFDDKTLGVPVDWDHLFSGFFAHWNKNANFAHGVDVWFLNLFPRSKPFLFNRGGYQTLNFVPSMGTMIFGLMAGELLRGGKKPFEKFLNLAIGGAVCLVVGFVLAHTVCPSVKRIWTPSWAVFSTGWTLWMLAGFYWIIDIQGYRKWAWPFVVVGMNSIAMYCMAQLLKPWTARTIKTHFGQHLFEGTYAGTEVVANLYSPTLQSAAVLFAFWLVCVWMYRQKIFIRI